MRVGSGKAFVPDLDKFGFVYIITNLHNGKAYIGCKQYRIKAKFGDKESNWKVYTGSSKWLNEDIEKIGKKHFKFEIIAEYKNKRSLRYYELYYQMKYNVLASTMEGSDEHAYYNSRVGGKFYRPVESYQDPEWRKKISEIHKKNKKFFAEAQRKRCEDPAYRKNISEFQKKRYEDPEERRKQSRVKSSEEKRKIGEASKKRYEDPEERRKTGEAIKKALEDPEVIKRLSKASKKKWADPEYKKRLSKVQKKRWEDPEARRKIGEASKKSWTDPEVRKKRLEGMKKTLDAKKRKKNERR